jgi:hypothetical protein
VNTRSVSFRAQLKGTVSDLLRRENMQCPDTEETLLELVVALSHYTEEGITLFPRVILCEDLETTLGVLQGTDPLSIGFGPRNEKTMMQALKRCAPLSRSGWTVYLLRKQDRFHYGVFRTSSSPTALDIRDTVSSLANENNDLKIILISQLADKAVELIGARSGCVNAYLSATPDDAPSPSDAIDKLSNICISNVNEEVREQLTSFFRKTMASLLMNCTHGTLIAVIPVGSPSIEELAHDGVLLERPVSFVNLVKEYEARRDADTLSALEDYSMLLGGMLATDGILILDTACSVLGYNIFVKDMTDSESLPSTLIGGARRRAYTKLCEMTDRGMLCACFIRSSDGKSDFYQKRA